MILIPDLIKIIDEYNCNKKEKINQEIIEIKNIRLRLCKYFILKNRSYPPFFAFCLNKIVHQDNFNFADNIKSYKYIYADNLIGYFDYEYEDPRIIYIDGIFEKINKLDISKLKDN